MLTLTSNTAEPRSPSSRAEWVEISGSTGNNDIVDGLRPRGRSGLKSSAALSAPNSPPVSVLAGGVG